MPHLLDMAFLLKPMVPNHLIVSNTIVLMKRPWNPIQV